MTDRTRLPLPEPVGEESHGPSQSPVKLYDADQMHAYSDAECAPLVEEIEALRQDGSKLTAENAALRERVKVLEDELGEVLEWAVKERAPLRNQEIASIRRALEQTS